MDEKQRAAMRRSWRNKERREEDECPICKGNFKNCQLFNEIDTLMKRLELMRDKRS